mmetsp:Transcript_21511/g.46086  ORF Transcript_21511/g.46086 Transcript_21511/m.46086 type:complete len:117 (-) Transcript_21511:12-362(-)
MDRVGYKNGKDVTNEEELRELLGRFFCSPALRDTALRRVQEFKTWFDSQGEFAFYASSLLFAYDTEKKDVCRMGLIDFANVEATKNKTEDLTGIATACETLVRVMSSLKPFDPAAR